ncbi:MAG TPA: hypothetical protein PKN47_23390 [Nitrospira sp.]|nr:hypothetical protein [Nitrospira sp.]
MVKNELSTAGTDLRASVKAANNGDQFALATLRKSFVGEDGAALAEVFGNLTHQAEASLLRSRFGTQEGSKVCVRGKLNQMRNELGWNEAPALERILIERVVITWASLYFAELARDQCSGGSVSEAKYHQYRLDREQRRHLSAVKMLATVRKMALPVLVDVRAFINVNQQNCINGSQPT